MPLPAGVHLMKQRSAPSPTAKVRPPASFSHTGVTVRSAAVTVVAADRTVTPVWENEAGGLTFAVGDGADRCFIKWTPAGSGIDLAAEADRMAWARPFHA